MAKQQQRRDVYVNDGEIINKALAYAIKAIEDQPEQLQEPGLAERIRSVLGIRTNDDDGRADLLLDDARDHLDGPGASLGREIKDLIGNAEQPAIMMMFLFQAIQEFAAEVAKANPDTITAQTNGVVDGRSWIACAKQVLMKREADASST